MLEPATITAIGGALAAVVASFAGGKSGGQNSLNGFKGEVRESFKGVNEKLDGLTKTDGAHEARLEAIERIVDRRLSPQPVLDERRVAGG